MDDPILAGIRLVSWDVDGTLFSYLGIAPLLARRVAQDASAHGCRQTARRMREVWRFHRLIERQRRHPPSAVDRLALRPFGNAVAWERALLDAALADARPRARAVALMERFFNAGVPQVAWSDFACASKLQALRMDGYFARAYSCENLGFWKPSPLPLAVIQREFGIAPHEHLHIGDRRDTDGAACRMNGCRFMPIDRISQAWNVFNAVCALSAE